MHFLQPDISKPIGIRNFKGRFLKITLPEKPFMVLYTNDHYLKKKKEYERWCWYQIKAESVLLLTMIPKKLYLKCHLFPVLWECIKYILIDIRSSQMSAAIWTILSVTCGYHGNHYFAYRFSYFTIEEQVSFHCLICNQFVCLLECLFVCLFHCLFVCLFLVFFVCLFCFVLFFVFVFVLFCFVFLLFLLYQIFGFFFSVYQVIVLTKQPLYVWRQILYFSVGTCLIESLLTYIVMQSCPSIGLMNRLIKKSVFLYCYHYMYRNFFFKKWESYWDVLGERPATNVSGLWNSAIQCWCLAIHLPTELVIYAISGSHY